MIDMLIARLILKLRWNDILCWSTHFFRDHILINFLLVIVTTGGHDLLRSLALLRRRLGLVVVASGDLLATLLRSSGALALTLGLGSGGGGGFCLY